MAVEAAGAQQGAIQLLQQVGGAEDDDVALGVEAIHLHQQLVEGLVVLAVGRPALAGRADGVELVDEDDRGSVLARLLEQPADAGRAQAGEHLDERGGRLGEERRSGLVGDRLGEQRLAGPGWAVEEDAARQVGAELAELLRVAQVVDDFAQLVLGLVDAGDVVPGDRRRLLGADLRGARTRDQAHRQADEDDDRPHEDQRQPVVKPGDEVRVAEERRVQHQLTPVIGGSPRYLKGGVAPVTARARGADWAGICDRTWRMAGRRAARRRR